VGFVETRSEQISNAALQLGLTNVNQGKGQESRFWPNLTGSFASKLVEYWLVEAARVQGHVAAIPSSAIRTQWLRAVEILRSQRAGVLAAAPHQLLPASHAVLIWTSIDGVALPLRAIADTPTKWDLVVESVAEAVAEVGSGTKKLVAGIIVALGLAAALKWR
jgi:hypothetical protein